MYYVTAVTAILICSFSPGWAQLQPDVVDEIIPEVTSQGGSARINCTVVNKGIGHTVVWDFQDAMTGGDVISRDQQIYVANRDCKEGSRKYEVVVRKAGNRLTYMLVVNCLDFYDTGRYTCYIQIAGLDAQQWPSRTGYLTVQVPPTITSKNDAVLELSPGQDSVLFCEATGIPHPNITWVRGDGKGLPNNVGALLRNKTLQFKKVSKQHRGLYRCVADNNVRPPDEYLVSVNVFFRPETEAVQDTVGQAQNRQFDAKLECKVSGYPEPELNWYRETTLQEGAGRGLEQLNDDEKYDISKQIATTTLRFGESWYTLRIKNVEANDYTRYFCVATNRIGKNDTTVIELFETFECQGVCPSFESSSAATIHMTFLFTIAIATILKFLI